MDRLIGLPTLLLLGLFLLAGPATAADEADSAPPPNPAREKNDENPVPTDEAPTDPGEVEAPIQELAPVRIRAPRIGGGPANDRPARTVTALRGDAAAFDVPAAVTVLEAGDLIQRRMVRSLPDALLRLPGVMVQKTAPLQVSPFIRGFTGYNNLLLIDGIRLNHSAFRAGPNQYWSTVDPYLVQRLEVVRGPHSVLYGSDAVGGTVNAITRRRQSFLPGLHTGGGLYLRGASAERALAGRLEVEGNYGGLGWLGGGTFRRYGDIESGAGTLPHTGGVDEIDGDLRFDWMLSACWTLTVAGQHFGQENAPRTERTIFSVPYEGTRVGTELQRDFDQQRDLLYARLTYDGSGGQGPISHGQFTVSYHRHEEERDRLRSGARRDLSGFTLDQYGAQLKLESHTRFGNLTYGFDYYHDEIDSFRRDYVGGALSATHVQGPVGDDSSYDLLGVYLQDHLRWRRWDFFGGVRFTYAAAAANRVDNPAVPGTDPTTPGNVMSIDNDWTDVVGSLKALYRLNRCWHVYGGLSQAFRAPSLSDLSALDSTSVVESPAPDLDPERYLSFEVGAKTQQDDLSWDTALWYTRINDSIIRSPTGVLIAGTPEVRKDNIGNGWAWGFETEIAWRPASAWTLFGNLSWMDAQVEEFDAALGGLTASPLSRMKPLTTLAGVRFEPRTSRFWAEAEWAWSNREDRLSLRDKSDTRRIPPAGTPAWHIVNLRAGVALSRRAHVTLALENLLDENYRIHGSGQNEVGRNLVLGLALDW